MSMLRPDLRSLFLAVASAATGSGCTTTPHPAPSAANGTVAWAGEQRKAILAGDAPAAVQLAELARSPHLYAVGPLQGMGGEITVWDGTATIVTVEGGAARTAVSVDHGAAFLVWTYAERWTPVAIPPGIRTLSDLEAALPELAASVGVDPQRPFAFRLEGRVEHLDFHVMNRQPGDLATMEAHNAAKVHFELESTDVRLIGFRSTEHHGIFTPGSSDIHLHVVTPDGRDAGHVESFVLAPGASLSIARPAG